MALVSLRRRIASRQLGWLVALALWLPMAQWAAATHTLLHLHASVSEEGDRPAHLPEACETCVVAATLLGAAAPPVFAAPPPLSLAAVAVPAVRALLLPPPPRAAYASRAPPLPRA
jgi:hypothetical protein